MPTANTTGGPNPGASGSGMPAPWLSGSGATGPSGSTAPAMPPRASPFDFGYLSFSDIVTYRSPDWNCGEYGSVFIGQAPLPYRQSYGSERSQLYPWGGG